MLSPYLEKDRIEAGCDEVGRGCLAGPVYAAAVILPPDFNNERLNDSKQLTEKQRYELRPVIEREALAWAIGWVSAQDIDRINILNASLLAMHRAVAQLKIRPEHLLIDGNRYRSIAQLPLSKLEQPDELLSTFPAIPATTIIKGDGLYLSIAAASILAKTYRDDFMIQLDKQYPAYRWNENKGYPTEAHRQALKEVGVSPWHRLTYHLSEDPQLSLF